MPNRKKAEAFILQLLKEIDPSGYNVETYKKLFEEISDKTFDTYMKGLRDKQMYLVLFKPMFEAKGITIENNFKVAEKYGLNFYERLIYTGNKDRPDHMTATETLVGMLPYRRQSQTLVKKISVPGNNKTIDQLTYQPTGASKGSKISYPELQVLIGMKLDKSIEELIQIRGGDRGGFAAYNAMIMRYGRVNLSALEVNRTGVESTRTLKIYMASMHIYTTL
jgi:hypothetical protein